MGTKRKAKPKARVNWHKTYLKELQALRAELRSAKDSMAEPGRLYLELWDQVKNMEAEWRRVEEAISQLIPPWSLCRIHKPAGVRLGEDGEEGYMRFNGHWYALRKREDPDDRG